MNDPISGGGPFLRPAPATCTAVDSQQLLQRVANGVIAMERALGFFEFVAIRAAGDPKVA